MFLFSEFSLRIINKLPELFLNQKDFLKWLRYQLLRKYRIKKHLVGTQIDANINSKTKVWFIAKHFVVFLN